MLGDLGCEDEAPAPSGAVHARTEDEIEALMQKYAPPPPFYVTTGEQHERWRMAARVAAAYVLWVEPDSPDRIMIGRVARVLYTSDLPVE